MARYDMVVASNSVEAVTAAVVVVIAVVCKKFLFCGWRHYLGLKGVGCLAGAKINGCVYTLLHLVEFR